MNFALVPQAEFERIRKSALPTEIRLAIYADLCRANTLMTIKRAGSGHIGTSFSAMDLFVTLYLDELNTADGFDDPNRDVFFSSKGHDAPGQYAVFYALGALAEDVFLNLRREGGTPGHPDVQTLGMEANTGSLGMGISKGKGIAHAKRIQGHGGRIVVLTGDGELQEGQIWESLQATVNQGVTNLTVIVDANQVQSDKRVSEISDLGDLEAKFRAFGWETARCNGHDFAALAAVFEQFRGVADRPKILIADTIKGRGVSFMEHPAALEAGAGIYPFHSGAPTDTVFEKAHAELLEAANARLRAAGLDPVTTTLVNAVPAAPPPTAEFVADAYGAALLAAGDRRPDLVVLDADLAADCRVRGFETKYPERFIESGIAEQDMVSTAGGLALQGLLPVVNSFGVFLAARANEQIYANATEQTKIIYVCHYAGLLPAGPGHSHQSVRDISLFGSLPAIHILQPCNAEETQQVVDYCIDSAQTSCMVRLYLGPSPRDIQLPTGYRLTEGQGVTLRDGSDGVIIAYGPVLLAEALKAAELAAVHGQSLAVVNMPWLNVVDAEWLRGTIRPFNSILVLDDHSPVGGLGDRIVHALLEGSADAHGVVTIKGVQGVPAYGTAAEALRAHGLDAETLAQHFAVRSPVTA